ncbi:MAG: hypothetical protein WD770_11090 [Actinomycetota bacterium]
MTIRAQAAGEDPNVGQYTCITTYRIGSDLQEFTSGLRESAGMATERLLGIGQLDEEYPVQQGLLRTGSRSYFDPDSEADVVIRGMAWEGQRTSIFTWLQTARSPDQGDAFVPQVGPTATDVLTLLEKFDISEVGDPAGAIMRPVSSDTSLDSGPTLVRYVPGIGLLEIHPASDPSPPMVPPWQGTALPGGQLYVDKMGPQRLPYFVLVSTTNTTVIVPNAEADVNAVLLGLQELIVEWRPPTPLAG